MHGKPAAFIGLAQIALIVLSFLPLAGFADSDDEQSPKYRDDGARMILSERMPFSMPAPSNNGDGALHIRKICVQDHKLTAQVFNSLVHFDLSSGTAFSESFPFQLLDLACGDAAHTHLLARSWPEGRIYPVAVKPDAPWSGWRRGNPIDLLKDEVPLGYVAGDSEVRVLTTQRLLSIKGDKLDRSMRLSKRIELLAVARTSIVRVGEDIYFGNDGGEWGGTLFRLDASTGKLSLNDPGLPIVSIIADVAHPGCVLVAKAVAHMMIADGELVRACHSTTQTLLKGEPVWAVSGSQPVLVGFSDGVGELKDDTIVHRRAYPSDDTVVAGMHYAQLPAALLLTSGVSQSVSVSGPVPVLVEWHAQGSDGSRH